MSKVTPIKRRPENMLDRPINVLNSSLEQAHAIADLVLTWSGTIDDDGEPSEPLCTGTLTSAIHSLILRIREAQGAAEKLSAQVAS
jgi:hypothetical protein